MRVLFVTAKKKDYNISPFILSQVESLKNNGVEIDYFIYKGTGLLNYLKAILLLRRKAKRNNYDIIHAHYSYSGYVAVLAFPKTPIIISLMGSDTYGSVNWKCKRTIRGYFDVLLTQLIQPFVSYIIVKSRNLSKYIYLKNKCEIIPNGVNFNMFRELDKSSCRRKLGLSLDKKLVLFLGNKEDPRKNFHLFKKSISILNDFSLELITPYPVISDLIPFYLNAADVLVMTSYLEGSPNVIKEAMVCNCPIVSTDVGDVKEVIGNTEGCYITSFDPKDVAEKIKMSLDFGKRTNGRENVKHLEINVIAKKIIDVYKEVINGQ